MPFIAGMLLWSGYTIAYWGWMATTDRVPPGPADQFHWPSIKDLVIPGQIDAADQAYRKQQVTATGNGSGSAGGASGNGAGSAGTPPQPTGLGGTTSGRSGQQP